MQQVEPAESRQQLIVAANQGDAHAQCHLAFMHNLGRGGPQDSVEGRRLFGLAADQGHSDALYGLGAMLHSGEGGNQDSVKARRLFGLAAEQGSIDAQRALAIMLHNGEGGPQSLPEARRLFGLAAEQGDADAQRGLGIMHREGKGAPQDLAEARRLFGLAAEQGDADAQRRLGIMNREGEDAPQDLAEARRLFGLAAKQGNADALCRLGEMHLHGLGGAPDFEEARRLLGLASAQGVEVAHYWLGAMHYEGKGGPQNLPEARRLFGLAAEQGDARDAQCHLGAMHCEGLGGPRDVAEARRLLGLAAAQGHAVAQGRLGEMHLHGLGGAPDFVEARRLLGLASAQGIEVAHYWLGFMHHEGKGGPQNLPEARRLFGLAAEQGDADAQRQLGMMHHEGEGAPQDLEEARRLFGLAAEQGDASAQYNYGGMCYQGLGGPQDLAEGKRQFRLAAAAGVEDAQQALARLESIDRERADAVMAELVAAEAEEKQAKGAGSAKKTKGRPDFVEARRLLGLASAQGVASALYWLGAMHHEGKGGPQNLPEARRLFGLAAEQGDADAQCRLGAMHREGLGGPQDVAEARWLFGLAAAQGHAAAQGRLGQMHLHGLGGAPDFVEARRLLGLASAQGVEVAHYWLGAMHHEGKGGPQDLPEARRLFGLAAEQGDADAQRQLGAMHCEGKGGPQDLPEARRLFGLAAEQGDASAQYNLGVMCCQGLGGPQDLVEGKRQFRLAAAVGVEDAQQALARLESIDRERADAMMAELVAAEAEEKQAKSAGSAKKTKGRKGSARAAVRSQCGASSAAASASCTTDAAVALADQALREVMAAGEYEALSSALEAHHSLASEAVLAEARALRNRLKDKRKQKSQKQRRAHAEVMEALARLQALGGEATEATLRAEVAAAAAHEGALPALDEQLTSLRARLEQLSIGADGTPAAEPASAPPAEVEAEDRAAPSRQLQIRELQDATDGFDKNRLIGRGGFGQVFLGEAPESLTAHGRRVAVKRADLAKLMLTDLSKEVAILSSCDHPHLLPLLAYCLDASAACLVFPLMVGGSLQTRLDLTLPDCEYLRRMGHFTSAPKPLTWRQKLRVVLQATGALVYLHTPSEGKGCTWHRDFKCAARHSPPIPHATALIRFRASAHGRPANILLDEHLHAYLGDTGFAKAAQRSGDRSGATTSVWGGAGSPGYCENALMQPDVHTEGFAVGVTLLAVLTGRDPANSTTIEEQCCEACEDIDEDIRFEDIPAARLAQPGADWPAGVADELKHLYLKLTLGRRKKRIQLPQVLQSLSALLQPSGQPHTKEQPQAAPRPASDCTPPTQLSQQVRRLRPAGASLKQNVSEGFDSLMYKLEERYHRADSDAAPPRGDFEQLLRFWHEAHGLPGDVYGRMQTLRRWRNASVHRDDAFWQRDGPRSAEEASEHLSALEAAISRLPPRSDAGVDVAVE